MHAWILPHLSKVSLRELYFLLRFAAFSFPMALAATNYSIEETLNSMAYGNGVITVISFFFLTENQVTSLNGDWREDPEGMAAS